MRVAGTILPTHVLELFETPPGFLPVNQTNLLGYQIEELRRLRKDPIVIIGPDGDDYLSATRSLVDRKMVFAREIPKTLLEQIEIGLQGAGTCAFFLPLNVPVPSPLVWQALETSLAKAEYAKAPHIFRPSFQGQQGWPLLITPRGKEWIEENLENLDPSTDFFQLPGLEIQTVEVPSETALQELRNQADFQEWKSLYAT